MAKRVFLIIDGSNFYHKVKELGFVDLLRFNFSGFAEFLTGSNKLISRRYYVGAVREISQNSKSKKLLADQQRLFARLKKQNFSYALGYLLKSDRYHEKGVDVNIAVDILVGAYENLYERVILVSSDTDLLPAIIKAREKGKEIEYVGFSHQPSFALIRHATETRLLRREDLTPFVSKKKKYLSKIK